MPQSLSFCSRTTLEPLSPRPQPPTRTQTAPSSKQVTQLLPSPHPRQATNSCVPGVQVSIPRPGLPVGWNKRLHSPEHTPEGESAPRRMDPFVFPGRVPSGPEQSHSGLMSRDHRQRHSVCHRASRAWCRGLSELTAARRGAWPVTSSQPSPETLSVTALVPAEGKFPES